MANHTEEKRPNPLTHVAVWRAVIIGGGSLATAAGLDAFNLVTESAAQVVTLLAEGGLLIGGTVAGATVYAGKKQVTPVADPRDNEGNKLVPEVTVHPTEYTI